MSKNFSDLRVVVIGDAILDNYTLGKVNHVSPEAPVSVLDIEEQFFSLGGAGNVWMNLRQLGVKADLVAAIGNDDAGRAFQLLLEAEGGNPNFLVKVNDGVTTQKRRFIDITSGYHLMRADEEKPLGFQDCQFDAMEMLQKAIRGPIDVLIISDYCKGLLDAGLRGGAVHAAKEKESLCVVDTKYPDWSQFAGADWVTPNLAEVEAATGAPISGENNLREIVRFAKTKGIGGLIVTMGAKGLTVCHPDLIYQTGPNDCVFPHDVTGAGDVVTAIFSAYLASGASVEVSASNANKKAGEAVEREGPCIVYQRSKYELDFN